MLLSDEMMIMSILY